MVDWEERAARARERHEEGRARLPADPDERQRQLTRMGNAAWAAGLSLLMLGRADEGEAWLLKAADTYRESWPDAPLGSWGRPIGAMKSRLIAGDWEGARGDARWALDAGAAKAESPIGTYAAVLAYLVLGDDVAAGNLASTLLGRDDFPPTVADTLGPLSGHDGIGYEAAIGALVEDFESRSEFLEEIPVADTVLAFQALAAKRELLVPLTSDLLPA
jgi:hypothetical protein